MEGIQTLKGSWPWPWPWIRPYGIPSCITHRPLPTYQISLKSKKLFVDGWTEVRTDVPTDGHFSPLILLGRLLEVDLKTNIWHTFCGHGVHLVFSFPISNFLPVDLTEAAAVTQWLRWRTWTQWVGVQLPQVPIWVTGVGRKGIWPKLLPFTSKSPALVPW